MIHSTYDIKEGTVVAFRKFNNQLYNVYCIVSNDTKLGLSKCLVLDSHSHNAIGKVLNIVTSLLLNKKSITIV